MFEKPLHSPTVIVGCGFSSAEFMVHNFFKILTEMPSLSHQYELCILYPFLQYEFWCTFDNTSRRQCAKSLLFSIKQSTILFPRLWGVPLWRNLWSTMLHTLHLCVICATHDTPLCRLCYTGYIRLRQRDTPLVVILKY